MIDKIKDYVKVKRAELKVWVMNNKFRIFVFGVSHMLAMVLGAILANM